MEAIDEGGITVVVSNVPQQQVLGGVECLVAGNAQLEVGFC